MKNRMRTVAAAVLVLGALQGCAVEDRGVLYADSESGPGSECVGSGPVGSLADGRSPDDTPLYRTLAYIDRTAAKRHAAVFTGLSVDDRHQAADVYRIPSAAFDEDICGAAEKGVTVRLHDTGANRGDLNALAARISADMHRWDGTFGLREVGVDERGWVNVGVDDPDTAEPVITEEFGEEHIRVVHVDDAQDQ